MRKLSQLLTLLLLPVVIHAQSIAIGPIATLVYCIGDSLDVPYTATGIFAGDNHFFVQLSDAGGSFASFTPYGNSTLLSGSIRIPLKSIGDHFRIRTASSDPYDTSSNNGNDIIVASYPAPVPMTTAPHAVDNFADHYAIGLPGQPITFTDRVNEPVGSTFKWAFSPDATLITQGRDSATVTFGSEGGKTASLTVTHTAGCATTQTIQFLILTCNPTIPADAHVVTGIETGNHSSVWVKAGGVYDASGNNRQLVFAEPGASINMVGSSNGIYYIKAGASVGYPGYASYIMAVMSPGASIPMSAEPAAEDTFTCSSLTFDYSQVSPAIVTGQPPSNVSIHQTLDHLIANAAAQPIALRLVSVLGEVVLTRSGDQDLDIDLSPLPSGVYFAEVSAGGRREVRRIIR